MMGAVALSSQSCSRDDEQVSLGLDDHYYLPRMQKLVLAPAFTGDSYRWTLRTPSGLDSVVATDRDYTFISAEEGDYNLTFSIGDGSQSYEHHTVVSVVHEETEYSPFTASVYEYCPAPGQFVNVMPLYEQGDNAEDMRRKAEDDITDDGIVSLGAFGGYVTFAFDHTVVNVAGQKDFYIKGNAFYSDKPEQGKNRGGSCEPGIVMVALDRNMNGRPDEDEWYELAGSELHNPAVKRNYAVTYHRTPSNHTPVKGDDSHIADSRYIRWEANDGSSGYLEKNVFHTQDYYPQWLKDDNITFGGTLLPQNGHDTSGNGQYYVLSSYPWGYVDNHPNDSVALCSFDIADAIDSEGRSVSLPGADFVRVYTAILQNCGWIGETSTEVGRATDLHVSQKQQKRKNIRLRGALK